ncbi:SbcC/MukB-like Walker B domain-containing protein, partial [Pseudomonadota bacterium]
KVPKPSSRNSESTQLSLLKKIQSFDDARYQLKDGEACPLCGSDEHPFAEGNVPVADDTMLDLNNARERLKTLNSTVESLKIRQAEINKDLDQVRSRQNECVERRAVLESSITLSCTELSIEFSSQTLGQILPALLQENADELNRITNSLTVAEALEKEIASQQAILGKTKERVAQLERATQDASHKKEVAQQTIERLTNEAHALNTQLAEAKQAVFRQVSVYGVEADAFDENLLEGLDQIRRDLSTRREQWLARSKEKLALEHSLATLKVQVHHQEEQIQTSLFDIQKRQNELNALQCERDSISEQRYTLFADKVPDEEERRLAQCVEAAESGLNTARQSFNTATQSLGKLTYQLEALNKSMTARTTQLQEYEAGFLARLEEAGFVDEARYIAARLSEEVRKQLMQQTQVLSDERTALTSKVRDVSTQLQAERQKQLTGEPRETLAEVLTNLVASQKLLQQEVGGIRQKLVDNENLKKTQQERAKAIDAQKRESLRWDLLHELIGSADGKKFRNFAQGLTFEMMVGHANRQLQKMTDRYLLIRDNRQPLELNVVDNYQAGEIRSTKNLSGGESFIVSLSLALGLSHMASKNVRVDSLFLDEGFGTLDEDALETALETLSGLQQDGKLIGVISHVSALKERINTQVLVSPQSGGKSIISGPGCGVAVLESA